MTATFDPATGEVTVPAREITAQQVMADLDRMAQEMNALSEGMAYVARALEPVEAAYEKHMDDYEIGLWEKHTNEDAKLPAEKMRVKLAHRAMDPALYGRYFALVKSRDRMVKRISALKCSIEANRSLLSAMKEGLVQGPGPGEPTTYGRRAA